MKFMTMKRLFITLPMVLWLVSCTMKDNPVDNSDKGFSTSLFV